MTFLQERLKDKKVTREFAIRWAEEDTTLVDPEGIYWIFYMRHCVSGVWHKHSFLSKADAIDNRCHLVTRRALQYLLGTVDIEYDWRLKGPVKERFKNAIPKNT